MTNLRLVILILIVAVLLLTTIVLSFQISPWPSALLLRRSMDKGGIAVANALAKHVPAGVASQLNVRYGTPESDARLDVFYPSNLETADQALPTIVWIHGGGWLAGSKDQIANYLKILAASGYTTIGVDYPLSPTNTYPAPLRQINAALAFIQKNAARLHVDPRKLFLAGDSIGSQLAAQLAAVYSAPSYAKSVDIIPSIARSQLLGVILYCGLYDGLVLNFKPTSKILLGSHLGTQLWSYIGIRDFMKSPYLEQLSVARHVTANFPPMFISVGNSDWLAPQSYQFADIVEGLGVPVDKLFFRENDTSRLYHEYQFDLDADAGRLALKRSVKFLLRRLQSPA
jgi:acetyl esterase/lipase